ncbi:hypothetical protein [uncultured Ilyobacter sp.]|jgi:hypothetical protein|uniref:hypothetical protein n=1 Tax=uncultured Ilyobacter sp. TaxID=544433 RepID=UPI0029BFF24F|nr:hypothetical protein [uncultured Ilyobacter sp.]
MKLSIKKSKFILATLGLLIFGTNTLFASNFVRINNNKNYSAIAADWSINSDITDKTYAETAAHWSKNGEQLNGRSYSELAANWSGNDTTDMKRNYTKIAAYWSNI